MDTASRRRSLIQTESLLEIVSRIKVRSFGDRAIRYLDDAGDRWIVFSDICKALGYKNPNHESKKVDPEEKRKLDIGLRNTLAVCINRRGLLRFVLFANKPEASEFLSWATREIFSDWNDEHARYEDVDPDRHQRVIDRVAFYKNLRSVLDEVEYYDAGGLATEYFGAACIGCELVDSATAIRY